MRRQAGFYPVIFLSAEKVGAMHGTPVLRSLILLAKVNLFEGTHVFDLYSQIKI
jgi:hypothetical protein